MKNLIHTAVVTLLAASTAQAQQAVQWKVSDGGNGHWYKLHSVPSQWILARQVALSQGGDLCSIETETERWQIASNMPCVLAYVGGYQLSGAMTPSDRWTWLTGTPVSLPLDCDDNPCIAGTAEEDGEQDYLHSAGCWTVFGDVNVVAYGDCSVPDWGLALFEWSTDCNTDGIVDFGQCHDGTLPDYNGNNIPDCCDQGQACVLGHYPVQWRVEDGGNGHWYRMLITASPTRWEQAKLLAESIGGHLATIRSSSENAVCLAVAEGGPKVPGGSVWLGGIQPTGESSAYAWVTGEPFDWTPGCGFSNTDQSCGFEDRLTMTSPWNGCPWNDVAACWSIPALLVEWSADCNSDGIVDYGQILTGQLIDADTDGTPDICQQPTCRDADLFRDLNVNGADLGILLSQWGPNSQFTVSDINKDGSVNGADLGLLLSFWGPCLN